MRGIVTTTIGRASGRECALTDVSNVLQRRCGVVEGGGSHDEDGRVDDKGDEQRQGRVHQAQLDGYGATGRGPAVRGKTQAVQCRLLSWACSSCKQSCPDSMCKAGADDQAFFAARVVGSLAGWGAAWVQMAGRGVAKRPDAAPGVGAGLDDGRVQVKVVRHDRGTEDTCVHVGAAAKGTRFASGRHRPHSRRHSPTASTRPCLTQTPY